MSATCTAQQAVKVRSEHRSYGATFPEGINPKMEEHTKVFQGMGSTVDEARQDLQNVINGYCSRESVESCIPVGESIVMVGPSFWSLIKEQISSFF